MVQVKVSVICPDVSKGSCYIKLGGLPTDTSKTDPLTNVSYLFNLYMNKNEKNECLGFKGLETQKLSLDKRQLMHVNSTTVQHFKMQIKSIYMVGEHRFFSPCRLNSNGETELEPKPNLIFGASADTNIMW